MRKAGIFLLLFNAAGSIIAQNLEKEGAFELYRAHLAAAEALLQINETGEAKEHLASAPAAFRGWEWDYLSALAEQSEQIFDGSPKGAISVAVNRDGSLLASGLRDSTIKVWNLSTGRVHSLLKGHGGAVTTIDFSRDGRFLVSGSRDKTIKVWDIGPGKEVRTITQGLSQGIYQVRFSPDAKTIAAGSWELTKKDPPVAGFAKIFSTETGMELKRLEGTPHPLSSVAFSPDGSRLIVGGWGMVFKNFDLATDSLRWSLDISNLGYYTAIQSLDVNPDGSRIVAGGKDKQIRILDASDGKLLHLITSDKGHKKDVNAVRFSPDGKTFASAGEDMLVKIWDGGTGNLKKTFRGHTGIINSVCFSPDGRWILTASDDGTIRKWDVGHSGELAFDIGENGPWYTAFSHDESVVAMACSDENVNVWNPGTGEHKGTFSGPAANTVVFTKKSGYLISAGHDKTVHVWDVKSMKEVRSMVGHAGSIYSVDALDSKGIIASTGDRTIRLWEVETGNAVWKYESPTGTFSCVKFSPDGKYMAAGMGKGTVKVWETDGWKELYEWSTEGEAVTHLAYDRSSSRIVAGGGSGKVTVWNVKTGKRVHQLNAHATAVYAVAFHPDGKRMVTASYDQTARIWDVSSGRVLLTLRNSPNEFYCTEFLGEGRRLMLTQTNGTIRILGK